jgi:LemA protein
MTKIWIIAGVVSFLILYVIVAYNNLVGLKNSIADAWSDIDTELKRRYELIPNLVSVVKGYASHEKAVLDQVTLLRQQCVLSQGAVRQQASDETQLVDSLKKLFAVAEAYPNLKADQHFLALQKELVITEDRIQAARRFYNGNIRDYQDRTQTFPGLLIASIFGFEKRDFFNVEPAVRDVPAIGKAVNS